MIINYVLSKIKYPGSHSLIYLSDQLHTRFEQCLKNRVPEGAQRVKVTLGKNLKYLVISYRIAESPRKCQGRTHLFKVMQEKIMQIVDIETLFGGKVRIF